MTAQANTPHTDAMDWIDAGPLTAIPCPGARQLRTEQITLAIVRTSSDTIYAIADACPHRGGPLSQGMVYGERLQCPMHGLVIDLVSGAAIAPDHGSTATYPVRINNGHILVGLTPQSRSTGCSGHCACAQAA